MSDLKVFAMLFDCFVTRCTILERTHPRIPTLVFTPSNLTVGPRTDDDFDDLIEEDQAPKKHGGR